MRWCKQGTVMHSMYRRDKGNQITTTWLWVGLSILGEVSEEKINGPSGHMYDWTVWGVSNQTEHETCNHLFQLAAIISFLFYYLILGLVSCVGDIQLIVDTLLMPGNWGLPELLERGEMEAFWGCFCKYCTNDIKDWSVTKPVDGKYPFITFLVFLPC